MFKVSDNRFYTGEVCPLFTREIAKQTRQFHRQIVGYTPTPLISLPHLAEKLGVKSIRVKDESYRFGLNAFKVLGGSYALGRLLAEHLGMDIADIDMKTIASKLPRPVIFITATAGNHGTGVAWAAREMGQKAVVYMPKGSSQASIERIKGLGAECIVTEVNYDDTVRLASQTADDKGWMLVQDTAWESYSKIPTWISQGYMTMADEAIQQLHDTNSELPTHVFLQAGVGAMAGGILGYLVDTLGADSFKSVIVEPHAADCIYRSGDEGKIVNVSGDLDSIMAGLACGEPNPVTWPILRDSSSMFASVADEVTALGMRILGNPLNDDTKITSGESGALGMGLLYLLSTHPKGKSIASQLGLNPNSNVLLFNTEGDTNSDRYQKIVWEGKYPL